ncbi:hypothetical protein ALQ86_200225 [Pseudomonas amygdali pv. eriobotryae]|uniref:MmgE/PrpD N-terminal domain-containing protein n=1 Tax=Pseudomonas amygdali pv. eriobotryae TaxID=129137 RepID=A0A3M3AS28_PSEA0|nr:hypothetical protein ALQ86_200225 [Pseudomonas amygdali pv. eriobotryae]
MSLFEFCRDFDFQQAPANTQAILKSSLLDIVAVMAGATSNDTSKAMRNYARQHYPDGMYTSRLIFDGQRVNILGAAWAGGFSADSLDAHEGHFKSKGHAGATVVPALLALTDALHHQGQQISGHDFLSALCIGYETALRAGTALMATSPKRIGHNPAIAGLFLDRHGAAVCFNDQHRPPHISLNQLRRGHFVVPLLRGNQGFVGSFASQPGYSGLVISLCQLSRSRVSPAEQFGEHHGGAGGCLASFGSSGIAGHTTCCGCQLSCLDAQPVASSVSDSSISKRSGLFLSCIVRHLVGRFLAALLFGSVLGGRGGHRFGLTADFLGPLRLPGQIGDGHAVPVCPVQRTAQRQQDQQQADCLPRQGLHASTSSARS